MATAAPRMQLAPDLDTGLAQLGCGSVCEGCAAKPLALLQRREKQAAARHPVGRVWPFSRRRPVRLTACGRLVGGEQPGGLQSSQQHEATGGRTASANTALRKGREAFKGQGRPPIEIEQSASALFAQARTASPAPLLPSWRLSARQLDQLGGTMRAFKLQAVEYSPPPLPLRPAATLRLRPRLIPK